MKKYWYGVMLYNALIVSYSIYAHIEVTVERPTKECSACRCRNCSYDEQTQLYTCECKTCFGVWHQTSIPLSDTQQAVSLVSIDGMLAYAQKDKNGCWQGWADGFPIKYCGEVCSINSDWQGQAVIQKQNAWFADFMWITSINGIEHKFIQGLWQPIEALTISKAENTQPVLFERERDRGA